MESIKPRTYNELMCYKRCMELKSKLPGMDGDMVARVYHFVQQSRDHRVVVENGMLEFQNSEGPVEEIPISPNWEYTRIVLSQASIHIFPRWQNTDSTADSGSSGNNNNNNNNNNA